MFELDQYQLVDFGQGRKLERFAGHLIERPSPASDQARPQHPAAWKGVVASFLATTSGGGRWRLSGELPEPWIIRHRAVQLELRPTDFGHLGVFPEQAENWQWIDRQVRRRRDPLRVLNLFGYTGGSTLAAAAAGASVVHVDASAPAVRWARGNAELSGLDDHPIRWIVEDARKFVRREVKRGNQYEAIVLDPPSYGHGPQGQAWQIQRDLLPLLQDCRQLLSPQPAFVLLTCHSPQHEPPLLEALLSDTLFGSCAAGAQAAEMYLHTVSGRQLHAGVVARWPA